MALYDMCWLPDNRLEGIAGYWLDERVQSPVRLGIIREVSRSFGAAETEKEQAALRFVLVAQQEDEAFIIHRDALGWRIESGGEAGLLYGLYSLIRRRMLQPEFEQGWEDSPGNRLRMVNHWDMTSGKIERGYAGNSIFYQDGELLNEFARVEDYARLLASVGINGISLNNVNVNEQDVKLIQKDRLEELRGYCDIFLMYGIKPYLSVNFASPVMLGDLETADPLAEEVQAWWRARAQLINEVLPGFGGVVVKADSEGKPGPFTYGRDHAQGANMLAEAFLPYGGRVLWRCFVYNCRQDWRDRETDRARAAYDNFMPLDGKFMENVVLQVKFGPMDFQVREPVSPLIGGLRKTNLILEMQVTQEYTGHQKHICYLPQQWQEVLEFDTYCGPSGSRVADVIGNKPNFGITAVISVGRDANWTGHKLAQANWYGYGRMAWDSRLDAGTLLREWITLSFDLPPDKAGILYDMMVDSRLVYESYTVPLGVGFMCTPGTHYGPSVDGYEYDRWGTYHFADRNGLGNDRTLAGTGYTGQYHEPNRSLYDNLETCPDDLLLFFHHVGYTHRLHSGKTVIQHIYDSHFSGFARVQEYVALWDEFQGLIPEQDFQNVQQRLQEQLRCAREWRDQVNTYFYRKSGIADEQGRRIFK